MGDNFQEWKQHFIDQAKGLIPHEKKFYRVSQQKVKEPTREVNIKMVSPTEQVVERAKATISNPPTKYDPVSGLMLKSEVENSEIRVKRKTIRKRAPKPQKRKVSKKPKSKSKSSSKKKTIKKKVAKKQPRQKYKW